MAFFEVQPPASAQVSGEAARLSRLFDLLFYPILFFVITGTFHIHFMLTAGDWDFWTDWKDRQWWPIVVPVMALMFPVITQYAMWKYFRLPIGATLCMLALWFGAMMNRVWGFEAWAAYPANFVWPSILIPGALILDTVLLLTKNWVLTAIFGASAYGLVFAAANLPVIMPFHLAVDYYGNLLSLADVQALHYIRTSTPEYLRLVERGTLRTFGGEVAVKIPFFAMFVCMMSYYFWWWVAKVFSLAVFTVRKKDVPAIQKFVEPEQIHEVAA
jgi:methane/ammonia monooxygenase subunit A